MMRLGAHNSISGGYHNAIAECTQVGGDTLQIFCKNQRQWRAKPLEQEEIRLWKEARGAAKVGPVMVHDSYLINMGNPDPVKGEAARQAFLDEYLRTEALGIEYLNFHPGSHMHDDKKSRDDRPWRNACLERIAAAITQVQDETKGCKAKFVIENAAGQGTNVGNSWEEVGHILDHVGDRKRMGVTVDTQHSWACGYDWVGHYDEVWDSFDSAIGLGDLVAFHLNDSKEDLGARVDRHDTMGSGKLGLEFFRTLVNDRRFDKCIGILETPEGPESWKKEIATLRSLRT